MTAAMKVQSGPLKLGRKSGPCPLGAPDPGGAGRAGLPACGLLLFPLLWLLDRWHHLSAPRFPHLKMSVVVVIHEAILGLKSVIIVEFKHSSWIQTCRCSINIQQVGVSSSCPGLLWLGRLIPSQLYWSYRINSNLVGPGLNPYFNSYPFG